MRQTVQDEMESLDEAPGRETFRQKNNWEGENQSKTSRNKNLLIADPVKPCQRTRAVVKGQTGRETHYCVINTDNTSWGNYF